MGALCVCVVGFCCAVDEGVGADVGTEVVGAEVDVAAGGAAVLLVVGVAGVVDGATLGEVDVACDGAVLTVPEGAPTGPVVREGDIGAPVLVERGEGVDDGWAVVMFGEGVGVL